MRYEVRSTATGMEYWDTEIQKTIFVPRGTKPDFKVSGAPTEIETRDEDTEDKPKFRELTIKQLNEYANENELSIPKGTTKHDDIVNWLAANV